MARAQGVESIPAAVRGAAERFGEVEALVDGPVRMTFGQLAERVRELARVFVAVGVRPGDRVALNSPNTHHWVLAALGASYAGATLVPVNTRFTGVESAELLHRSKARALVVADEFLGVDRLADIREAAGDGPGEVVAGLPELRAVLRVPVGTAAPAGPGVHDWDEIGDLAAKVPASEVERRADAVTADDLADVLFTSGTTGRAKGVMSLHRQTLGVAAAWAECGKVRKGDRYLLVNPFSHSFGYKAGILVCLLTGTAMLPQAVFDAASMLDVIDTERISILAAAPTIFQTLLHALERGGRELPGLRLAVTGAATVPVALVERMRSNLGFDTVLTAYGLTEAVVATMCRPGDDAETVAHTCGRAAAGFEVAVVDADGEEMPAGQAGEVVLRGPNVMRGYLDDLNATAHAIDSEGRLHTGDIGVLDDDGYLRITDRLKDMYVCGGFNVYPAEVEQALAYLDGVRDVAVIGVPHERLGEVGKAYVVGDDSLTEEEVLAFCKQRLANFKLPRTVEFVGELPRNASGKILKRVLADR
ncbi:FadD3 family acyl-CoA ligase [Saccharopolyspora mangrovi]|uniref:FadD3 family acyl-CoA ligase n=1 Tax=Saccharopolyspora mangrovi TaxID=3082379 RepID=A0ABU6A951_9PSEU|nr:FadD3 family acyl-CoA ligase [Saccharopolyspora sp. S2-29]MEB3368029.1 FadD3 family acyl-CoA ligase [Saccharopolyspora sp. S2-29]